MTSEEMLPDGSPAESIAQQPGTAGPRGELGTERNGAASNRPGLVRIDHVLIDAVSMDDAVARIAGYKREARTKAAHVVTVNAQFVELAHYNQRFADLLKHTDLSVADGVPLVWASRLLKTPLPGRVNGTDLMVRLCKEAAGDGSTVYFLGGQPGAAELAAERLQKQFPGLTLAGVHCPEFGFLEGDGAERAHVADRITRAKPDVVFVALGAPKQEFWIQSNVHLPAKVMIGVGGSFDLVAGFQKRAPLLFQKAGCEWLWRLFREPRRLFKRYLIGNSLFVYVVLKQWMSQRRG